MDNKTIQDLKVGDCVTPSADCIDDYKRIYLTEGDLYEVIEISKRPKIGFEKYYPLDFFPAVQVKSNFGEIIEISCKVLFNKNKETQNGK